MAYTRNNLFKYYDAFISYVVEDNDFVIPLVQELEAKGFRIWYVGQKLIPGTQILDIVNQGLDRSGYGIIILSPDYTGSWTAYELRALLSRHKIIPVWHKITHEGVIQHWPELMQIYATSSEKGMNHVVFEISKAIRKKTRIYYWCAQWLWLLQKRIKTIAWVFFTVLALAIIIGAIYWRSSQLPDRSLIDRAIQARINFIEENAKISAQEYIMNGATVSEMSSVRILSESSPFLNSSYQRNTYRFNNDYDEIRPLVQLKKERILPENQDPEPPFGLDKYCIYIIKRPTTSNPILQYFIANTGPVTYEIVDKNDIKNSEYQVTVIYSEAIRLIEVNITADKVVRRRSKQVNFYGLRPKETYVFEKRGMFWTHTRIF